MWLLLISSVVYLVGLVIAAILFSLSNWTRSGMSLSEFGLCLLWPLLAAFLAAVWFWFLLRNMHKRLEQKKKGLS